MVEIVGLDQLRQYRTSVVGGVSRVIHHAAILLNEAYEARVLDPVAFVGGYRKDDPLAHLQT